MNYDAAQFQAPSLETIERVAQQLNQHVIRTPTVPWPVPLIGGGPDMQLFVKLELLQKTGSFKARGAMNVISQAMATTAGKEFSGVTAFSAGNHAIATAFAAKVLGTSAKVVMPKSANAMRRRMCEIYGADVVFGDTVSDLIDKVAHIQETEGRILVHPFEGLQTVEGTATVGMELCTDIADLDAVIVPVGGGGLIAGIACAVKQMQPHCKVIGVEPEGANGMQQSLAQGAPMAEVIVNTVADSLGAPMHTPFSYALVAEYVDEIVTVSDGQMREGMRSMLTDMKLAVEPACAASLAAVSGPLAASLREKKVAMIACGSNIDPSTFSQLIDNV